MYVGKALIGTSRSKRGEAPGSPCAHKKPGRRQRKAEKCNRPGDVVVHPFIADRDLPDIHQRQDEGKMGANHQNAGFMKKLVPEIILILYAFFATQAFIACGKSHTPIEIIEQPGAVQAHALMGMSLAQLAQVKVNI